MKTDRPSGEPKGFVRIHVRPFEEGGLHFAECKELKIIAGGETESEALVHLFNKVSLSLAAARLKGTLGDLIRRYRMKTADAPPDGEPVIGPSAHAPASQLHFFYPLPDDADSRAAG